MARRPARRRGGAQRRHGKSPPFGRRNGARAGRRHIPRRGRRRIPQRARRRTSHDPAPKALESFLKRHDALSKKPKKSDPRLLVAAKPAGPPLRSLRLDRSACGSSPHKSFASQNLCGEPYIKGRCRAPAPAGARRKESPYFRRPPEGAGLHSAHAPMARLRESSYFRKTVFENGSSLCRSDKKQSGRLQYCKRPPEDQPISPAAMRNFLPSGSV